MSQVYASLESVRFSSLSYVHLVSHNQTVDMLRPMSKPYNIPGIVDANAYADILGASPAYHQKEYETYFIFSYMVVVFFCFLIELRRVTVFEERLVV